MKTILILLFITSCWNDPDYCYECRSPIMQDVTFCGYTPEEMQSVIDWRADVLGDTLICTVSK